MKQDLDLAYETWPKTLKKLMIASLFVDGIEAVEACLSLNLALNSDKSDDEIWLGLFTSCFVAIMLTFRMCMMGYLVTKNFNAINVR